MNRTAIFNAYAQALGAVAAIGDAREESNIDPAIISPDFEGMDLCERLETVGFALARARIMCPIEALAHMPEEYQTCEPGTFLADEISAKGISVPRPPRGTPASTTCIPPSRTPSCPSSLARGLWAASGQSIRINGANRLRLCS